MTLAVVSGGMPLTVPPIVRERWRIRRISIDARAPAATSTGAAVAAEFALGYQVGPNVASELPSVRISGDWLEPLAGVAFDIELAGSAARYAPRRERWWGHLDLADEGWRPSGLGIGRATH